MKVLHVVPWYEPAWASGGTAAAVSTLCRSLAAKGIDVTVYTTNDKGGGQYLDIPLDCSIDTGGVKAWYFKCGLFSSWKAAAYSRGLAQKLKHSIKNYDIVHISSTRHWHGFEVYKLTRSAGIPYIISPHASLMKWWIEKIGNKYFKVPYMRLFDNRVTGHTSAIHYLCEGERSSSKSYDFSRPSFIVPNGIQLDDFMRDTAARNRLRAKYNIPEDSVLLLHLGRIHPQKNIHLIIDALSIINTRRKNIVLFIVGPVSDPKYYQYLQSIIQNYGLNSAIRFFPPVMREDVNKWYSIADLLVMPSEVEGISMSVIEALAASLPVLISNRAANFREISKDQAGLIVNPTAESIASAFMTVLSKPQLLSIYSENAKKSARHRFDIASSASLMIKAYENVLTGKRDPELHWI